MNMPQLMHAREDLQHADRCLAQAEMAAALERYTDLYDFTPIGHFTVDTTGLVLQVNLAGAALLGQPRAAVVGQRLSGWLGSGAARALTNGLGLAFSGQECPLQEILLANGTASPRVVYLGLRINASGATCRVVMLDVTARPASQGAAITHLADSPPVLLWMSGPEGRCFYFNQPWLQFTGRSEAQEFGEGWTAGVHPDDRPDCLATYAAALAQRQPFVMVYRLRHASGEYRWPEDTGVPRYDDQGGFLGYVGACLDITARKQVEADQRVAAAVYASLDDGLLIADADNRIVAVNPAFTRLTGFAAAEVLGQDPKLLKSGRHDAAFYQALWDSLGATGRWSGAIINRRRDGTELSGWLTIQTLYDEHDRVLRRIALFTEGHQRKTGA